MPTILDRDYMDMEIGIAYRFLDAATILTELHDHNYCEYFIITSGSILHEANGETQKLKTGDLAFIRPKDRHRYRLSEDSKFKMINISFRTSRFDEVKTYYNNPVLDKMWDAATPPIITLSPTQMTSLKKKHYLLNVTSGKKNQTVQLKSLLVDIFAHFILEYEQQQQFDSKKWLQSVLIQMNTPENIEEGLPALIRYSGFSHGHLCRIMKQELGRTPTQFVTDLRLQYAANLFATTDYSILSIVTRLGFSSLSHFITIFKAKYGMTPSKYRTQNSTIYRWK